MYNSMEGPGLAVRSLLRVNGLWAMMLMLAGCAMSRPMISSFEETVEVQARINRYFRRNVIPNLRTCWIKVQGTGTIAIAH